MRLFLLFVISCFLAGCSGTGGIIGGLVPAPKFLKGEVNSEGEYISENREFSVILPHPPERSKDDRYEWTYTKVHEINEDNIVVGAVFGPAAFDLNLYHAVIIKESASQPLEPYVQKVFDGKSKGRNSNLRPIAEQQFDHLSKRAFYSVYESESSFLILSLVAGEEYFYVVEIDISKNSARNVPTKSQLIDRSWEVFNQIFSSFKVLSE
ncbi:hypothetical protein IB286_06215 [Spongiibacter sp. KMU-158]|uniref:Uncharacterized protein n=1 Tax=Spongiibacter pelagi TaxID=2760804 RepID=A0A927GVF1_9GAMM|nr:hypothetical protein [Spongiibacter pelagi]MBD2858601.1 hypothetical protein [Spongiibacter pelagi]